MPWRKRGRTIPASCADLDLEAAGRELIRAERECEHGGEGAWGAGARSASSDVYAGPSSWTRRWRLRSR